MIVTKGALLGFFASLLLGLPTIARADFDAAAQLYRDKQYADALAAFHPLAQAGDVRAQSILGLMYKFGEGTKPDLAQSYRWYLTAARRGFAPAQFHTAIMYAEGIGVEMDEQKATYWLKKAAEQGYEKAEDKLAELNADVRPKQPLAWSKDWDLSLPTDIRFGQPDQQNTIDEGNYWVQVGAMGTRTAANRLWDILTEKNASLFEGKLPKFSLVEQANNRRVYRIQTGPFSYLHAAEHFCTELLKRPHQAGCILLKQ